LSKLFSEEEQESHRIMPFRKLVKIILHKKILMQRRTG
jgi:hypothetical protein